MPAGAPLLAVLPDEPLAPPFVGCVGNGDSGPPPWLDACPPLEPWLDDWPPPDDEGDGADGGDDDGDEGLGSCGIDGDWVEVVVAHPAMTSAQMAGQSR